MRVFWPESKWEWGVGFMRQEKEPDTDRGSTDSRIGQTIKLMRRLRGYTQEQLGEKIGVTASSISQFERGEASPKLDVLEKIIDVLEADANLFFSRKTVTLSDTDMRIISVFSSLSKKQRASIADSMELLVYMLRDKE